MVRQGDFALGLAQALELQVVEGDEEQAVQALTALGIEPAEGWMPDYPMTPLIVTELRNAVVDAAAEGRLDMAPETATRIFMDLAAEFGLPFPQPDDAGLAGAGAPVSTYGPYCDGIALHHYYGYYGLPLYSYCRPPLSYIHLYTWVPCGFHWYGYRFAGFFILKQIRVIPRVKHVHPPHRIIVDHGGKKRVHHHRPDRRGTRIDPALQPRDPVTAPRERRRASSVDGPRSPATAGIGDTENPRLHPRAAHVSQLKSIVRPDTAPSHAAAHRRATGRRRVTLARRPNPGHPHALAQRRYRPAAGCANAAAGCEWACSRVHRREAGGTGTRGTPPPVSRVRNMA